MSALTQLARVSHLSRRRLGLRQAARSARTQRDRLIVSSRRVPVPAALRRRMTELVMWRSHPVVVPIDRLLLGEQNQVPAAEFARRSGDLLWPSTRVADGPHADLLRRAEAGPLTDEEILATPYARMARATIAVTGQYFAASDEAGIVAVARRFLEGGAGDGAGERAGEGQRMPHQSREGDPVRVAPILHSDCFQLVDGHHRAAVLAVAGAEVMPVTVRRVAVTTPLQDLLEQMSWTGGERELYQPVASPELAAGWTQVRRCVDRLDAMRWHLSGLELAPSASYLDVASCYGWFVDQFARLGFQAEGVERDPRAPAIGSLAYGLDPARVTVSDAERFLADTGRTWDVVSCFSLLHHFALGRASIGPEQLLHLLDRATGRVLYLDTGQAHEAWFRESLPEWDTEYVRAYLSRHTTFDEVVDLGPDCDDVPPYQDNYRRHLFAAVRTS
jgi:hypothetical protein